MKLLITKIESFLINEKELPEGYIVSKKGKMDDGRFFLIINKGDYSTSRVFIGKGKSIQEVEVTETTMARDGGTTTIDTELGKFIFPSPLKTGTFVIPTFSNAAITML